MANPWAPQDPSSSTGRSGPDQPPVPVTDPAPHAHPGAHHPAPEHPAPQHPDGPGGRPVPPPDPAGIARSSRAAMWSAAALLGSLLLMSASYPVRLVAPVTAITSLVLAIVAVVRASRARARGAVVALPVVLLLASLGWVGVSSQTYLYVDAMRDHAQCTSAALTQQARRTCAVQLETDMTDRLTSLLQRLGAGAPPAP